MNEQIKLLAEQAGYTKDMFGIGHWDMPECQKFAKLIAAECISVVTKLSPNYPLRYKNNLLIEINHRDQIEEVFREDCVEEIKQHFGVE
jgi:CTP:phosphocholine cytidylyltransferase-like protein